tara:strand:+ start:27 stop:1289 length:1263 start_codon:yes stop_codon:yes gene_type:complete
MKDKIHVLVLSDHPLSPSGVGTQTKYMIESLLATGKFRFTCFGGAVKHQNYTPLKVKPWMDDWMIYPVDGYGTQDMVRSVIRTQRPDMMWFMTDPRFWGWLWDLEDEIRAHIPMVYYHVWDNYPYPDFNKNFYRSNDCIVSISKLTSDVVKTVAPDVKEVYLPHAVDNELFSKKDQSVIDMFLKEHFENHNTSDKFVFFWNSRNAKRKLSGSVIFWFKDFLDKVGHDKAALIMHTDVRDPHGQDLVAIVENLGLVNQEVIFSQQKLPAEALALLYNISDCVISISDAEGFGLSNLEGLSCEKPIIVTMTGGMQEQVTDGENWFGVGIEPASKAIIGSLEVPYIYEDRVSGEDVVNAMLKMYNMTKEEREEMGRKGREHVLKNYGFKEYGEKWADLLLDVHEKMGSWETRRGYKAWEMMTL